MVLYLTRNDRNIVDKLRSIEMFVRIVDAGTLSEAASQLSISTAAVSRGLSELEDSLGTRLLHRSSRRLSSTESGTHYYARCKQILEDLAEADDLAAELTTAARGKLRINVAVSFGILRFATIWKPFLDANPGLKLDVTLSDRFVDLLEEGYDFALRITDLQDSSIIARQLARTRLVLCASPAYLAHHGQPESLSDLSRHRCLTYTYQTTRDEWIFTHAADKNTHRVMIDAVMAANNGDVLRSAALEGAGIPLLPTFLIGEDLAAGRLVEVLPAFRSRSIGVYGIYPTRRHVPAKTRALLAYLQTAFGTDPESDPWDTRAYDYAGG